MSAPNYEIVPVDPSVHAEQMGQILLNARLSQYGNGVTHLTNNTIIHRHDDVGGYASFVEQDVRASHYARVASTGERVLGFVITKDKPLVSHISWLYVAPSAQDRGLGGQLLSGTIKDGESRGKGALSLYVWDRNIRAQSLYKRNNFDRSKSTVPVYYGDAHVMMRFIKNPVELVKELNAMLHGEPTNLESDPRARRILEGIMKNRTVNDDFLKAMVPGRSKPELIDLIEVFQQNIARRGE